MKPTKLLLNLMNLQVLPIDDVIRTSDGFYIGHTPGDCGFNAFIGSPSPVHQGPGLERTLEVWDSLTEQEREAVRHRAAHPLDGSPIPLEAFGIPEGREK